MKSNRLKLITGLLLCFVGCQSTEQELCDIPDTANNLIEYSDLLSISEVSDQTTIVRIQTNMKDQHFILKNNKTETCYNTIEVPLKRMIVFSATHLYMLDTLGSIANLIGFTDKSHTSNQTVRRKIKEGDIKVLGTFNTCDLEMLLSLKPDAVMISEDAADQDKIKRLQKAGIPVIYNVEWQEQSPLGRAEWLKLFGYLTGKQIKAEEIFRNITNHYDALKTSAQKTLPKYTEFLYGTPYGSTWYLPGQKSFMSEIIKDAGIEYFWPENDKAGSIKMDVESMLHAHFDTPLWIIPGHQNSKNIEEINRQLTNFRAFREGNIYITPTDPGTGIPAYWEKSVLRCDLLLEDIINITREKRDNSLNYYQRLKD